MSLKQVIVPAILVKTKKKLEEQLKALPSSIKMVHIDIMDKTFVKNSTVQAGDFKKSKINYEMHLMVRNPIYFVEAFKEIGAKTIIFHLEACKDKKEALSAIALIKKKKMKVGIALNPSTKIFKLKPYLSKLDLVLLMTVHPGRQGQKFMPSVMKKVEEVRKISKVVIECDGGINMNTISKCKGVKQLVVGSGIFKNSGVKQSIKALNNKINKWERCLTYRGVSD